MEISKINNQTSFGSKTVVIKDTVVGLGSKAVGEVRSFLTEAYKSGDDTIGLVFQKEPGKDSLLITASKLIEKSVLPEKRSIIGKILQKIFRTKPVIKDIPIYDDTQKIYQANINQDKLKEVTQLAINNVEDKKTAIEQLKLAKEESAQISAARLLGPNRPGIMVIT